MIWLSMLMAAQAGLQSASVAVITHQVDASILDVDADTYCCCKHI